MDTYVYVRKTGSGTTIRGDREFTSIGQRIELPEKDFSALVLGGGAFIPEHQFKEVGFSDADIRKYGPGYFGNFDDAFLAKCALAEDKFRKLYAEMLAGGAQLPQPELVAQDHAPEQV